MRSRRIGLALLFASVLVVAAQVATRTQTTNAEALAVLDLMDVEIARIAKPASAKTNLRGASTRLRGLLNLAPAACPICPAPVEPLPPDPMPTPTPTPTPAPTGFAQVIAGTRPRGFGVRPYARALPTGTGVERFVSTAGNDLNAGTSGAPFRTINKAAQVAVAGDVVTIASGTYTGSVSVKNGGTASAPIVFQAAEQGGAILSGGSSVFGPTNWTGGLVNTGAVYVTVRGLVFRNYGPFGTDAEALRGIKGWRIENDWFDAAADNAVNLRGDTITVTGSTFTANNRHAIVAWGPCGSATGPDDPAFVGIAGLVITDNVITGNNPSTVQPPAGSGSAVIKILASRGALVENNESGANYGPGLWLDSCNADYTIQDNYLHDNVYRYVRARGLDIEISWRGIVRRNVIANNDHEGLNINNTSGLLVEDNLVVHNRRAIVITAAARGAQFPCKNNTIQRNQFRDWFEYAAVEGLIGMTTPSYPAANHVVVDGNTYQPVTSKTLSGWWGYFISSLATSCANIGWECHGTIGPVAWPPQ